MSIWTLSQSPPPKTTLPVLYYSIIAIGIVAVVLSIYNLVIIRWCTNHRRHLRDINQQLDSRRRMSSSSMSGLDRRLRDINQQLDSRRRMSSSSMSGLDSINLGESFKYKKEGNDSIQLGFGNNECPVCLCVFEEDEDVRELPRCKHSFHAPCIEMWLYSHLDCPLCRTPVDVPVVSPQNSITESTPEHSREVFIDPRVLV